MTAQNSEPTMDVLVASAHSQFSENVRRILQGYYPYKIHDVQDSDSILSNTDSFNPLLAIVDGRGGTLVASEWVQSVKMTYPDCPVIVLYSAGDDLDFALVKKNGANHIMHLSFDREFISDMVLKLAPVEMRGTNIPLSSLMPIDLRDVDPEEPINFDVYIHLPANHKSFRVRKSGGKIDDRLLERAAGSHQRLYIKKTQMRGFFEYARTILTMRNVENPIPQTEKLYKSKQLIHEIISEILNAEAGDFQAGKAIFERCRQILTELDLLKEKSPKELSDEILRYTGNSRSIYHDAINLAVFASNFAALSGLTAEKREQAALAGLLHNIGLAKMPASSLEKDVTQFDAEELQSYRTYPDSSVVLIKSKKVPLPQETSNAIVQHQENADGSGFPHGLQSDKIDPLAKILRFSLRFQELSSLENDRPAMTPQAAIDFIRDESLTSKQIRVDLITATQLGKKLLF